VSVGFGGLRQCSSAWLALCAALATTLLGSAVAAALPTGSAASVPEVEALLDRVVLEQLDAAGIPGAGVAVVLGGEVTIAKGYGSADLETGRVADADTLFRVGSLAKVITFTAVMRLAEEGRLDLAADVGGYLDFALPPRLSRHPFRGDPGPITLAHLLTHTAGFEDARGDQFFLDPAAVRELGPSLAARMPARIFPPGEIVAYSNYGAALAGYVVERVTGQPFAVAIDELVLAPLGMTRSTFSQPPPQHLEGDLARASRQVEGVFHRDRFVAVAGEPAGSLSTTASDMARFMLAHLTDGGGVLAPETLETMHARQFAHHPSLDGMAFGFVERTVDGRRALFHGGDIFTFQSGLFLLPEHEAGLFVVFSGGGYDEPLNVFHAFLDAVAPGEPAELEVTVPAAGERSRALVGEYQANRRSYSSDESLLTLLEALHVGVDADGFLTVGGMGAAARFGEVEPGVFRALSVEPSTFPYGAFNGLVFASDAHGRPMLFTDGKVSYARAPWYRTTPSTLLAVGGTALLSLLTLGGWTIASLVRRVRRRPAAAGAAPRSARLIRWTAGTFAASVVLSLLGAALIVGDVDPLLGQPLAAFGIEPAWSPLLLLPSLLLIVSGVALVPCALLAWRGRIGSVGARLHVSLLAASAALLLPVLYYWNLLV
jgi:CubicO group peptidase (beta-lactamase class C family)